MRKLHKLQKFQRLCLAITAEKVKAGLEGHAISNRDNKSQAIKAGSKEWLKKELSTSLRRESVLSCLQSRLELLKLILLRAPLNVENSTNETLDASLVIRKLFQQGTMMITRSI